MINVNSPKTIPTIADLLALFGSFAPNNFPTRHVTELESPMMARLSTHPMAYKIENIANSLLFPAIRPMNNNGRIVSGTDPNTN